MKMKKYMTPLIVVVDLKANNLMEDTQIGVHSQTINQNPDNNDDDSGAFAKQDGGWFEDSPFSSNLWDD